MKKHTKVLAIFLSLLLSQGNIPALAATEYIKCLISSDGDFTPGSTDVIFTANHGHAEQITLANDEHGSVINMGIASDDPLPGGATPQADFGTGTGYTHLNFEFEVCVQEKPTGKGLTLSVREALNNPDIFKINGDNFESGSGSFAYQEGKWYTISVEVNMTSSGYYSVDVIDGATVTNLSTKVSQAFGTFSKWRFWGYWSKSDFCEFYLDNFKFYSMVEKPADYIEPNVSITADKDEYYYGETANLTVSPQGNYLENTTVYIDNEKIGTYTTSSISIPYTPSSAGSYAVKAVTKNTYGITAEKECTLKVNENENPSVSFQGIDSAVTFEEDDDMTLTVNAEDDIEVEKIELYVAGELKETVSAATLSYDFAQLDLDYGTYEVEAKTYDILGLTASKKISVTLQPENYTEPSVSITADTFSAVCGETIELSVTADGSHFEGVDVYVNDTLQESYTEKEFTVNVTKSLDGDYKVKAVVMDTIGKTATDEKTVTFTLPDGYIAPSVTLSANETSVKLGEAIQAQISLNGSHWTDADVYLNGELYQNYEQASFNISYTPDSAGTYKIKAVAKDEFNKTDEKEITFVVNANAAPTVSFDGIENGGIVNYEYDAAKLINISAEDSDGIEKLEVFVDDTLKATESTAAMQLDFDTLGLGLGSFNLRAVAYDNYGLSDEAQITLSVTSSLKTLKAQNSNFTSDITFTENRGHAGVGVVDATYGNSAVLGMAEGETASTSDYSRADIAVGGYTHTEFNFDIYVQEKPTAKGVTLLLRTTDGNNNSALSELFCVSGGKFVSGAGEFSYETEKWYTVSVEVDMAGGWYSTAVIDGANTHTLASFVTASFGNFSLWRFHTGTNTSDYYEIAVDNFKFYEIIAAPSVVSVGYDDVSSSTKIPSSAQKINVVLDDALTAEDINTSNVKLMKGAQEIKIKRVQYSSESNTVSVVLDTALESATDYSIVFDENIRISGTTVLGDKIIASFKTAPSGAEVEGIVWKAKKDNSADLSFTAKNLALDEVSGEYDGVPVCCIVTLWDSITGRFVKAYADSFTLSEAAKSHSMNVPNGALYKAEIYFANSFTAPQIYEVANFAK